MFFGKACVTMRDQTEWVEFDAAGANELVEADQEKILAAAMRNLERKVQETGRLYGGGRLLRRLLLS